MGQGWGSRYTEGGEGWLEGVEVVGGGTGWGGGVGELLMEGVGTHLNSLYISYVQINKIALVASETLYPCGVFCCDLLQMAYGSIPDLANAHLSVGLCLEVLTVYCVSQ